MYGRWAILSGLKPRHKNLFQYVGSNGKIRAIGRYRLWLKKNKIFFIPYLTQADLVLIHQSFNDYYGTYRAMEEAYKEGWIRAIGVSNFYPDRLIDLCSFAEVKPAVNQVETHVFQQQVQAHEYMEKYGVQHESWGPFAEGRKDFFTNPVLMEIGKKYDKSAAQTALRFLIQSGVVVIPKSTHKIRMIQNIDVFDFVLNEEDMAAIRKLDTKESLFFSHYDPSTVEMLTGLHR